MDSPHHTIRSWQARLPFPHNLCVAAGKKTDEALLSGQRVKEARGDRSQSAFAHQLRITPSALGNYEQGLRKLPQSVAKAIQRETGIPAAYLLGLISEADRDLLMAPPGVRGAFLQAIRQLQPDTVVPFERTRVAKAR